MLGVKRNADPDLQDRHRDTALLSAVRQGHVQVCRVLVASGTRLGVENAAGDTAMALASGLKRRDLARGDTGSV